MLRLKEYMFFGVLCRFSEASHLKHPRTHGHSTQQHLLLGLLPSSQGRSDGRRIQGPTAAAAREVVDEEDEEGGGGGGGGAGGGEVVEEEKGVVEEEEEEEKEEEEKEVGATFELERVPSQALMEGVPSSELERVPSREEAHCLAGRSDLVVVAVALKPP